MQELTTRDARAHAQNIRSGLDELKQHLRRDIEKVDDPRARALFETAAEELGITESAVRNRMHRMRQTFAEMVEKEGLSHLRRGKG